MPENGWIIWLIINLINMGEQKYSYQLDNMVKKSLESTKYNKFILCIIGWVLWLFQEKTFMSKYDVKVAILDLFFDSINKEL